MKIISFLSTIVAFSPLLSESEVKPNFHRIDSSRLETPFSVIHPPLIGKSDFVPFEMVEHLMRHKKDSALGVKYVPGDAITHMEGAMHTFVTPICPIAMTGDYDWVGRFVGESFGHNQVRNVILSAAIHPDFEDGNVVMPLIRLGNQEVEGKSISTIAIPSAEQKQNEAVRESYESELKRHMIYHLSPDHRLPALKEIHPGTIMEQSQAEKYLEAIMGSALPSRPLYGLYVRTLYGDVISLEILFRIYFQQLRNEFKVLDRNTTQGYVYTIRPPSIFGARMGGADLMNRIQALALKSLQRENLFSSMAALAFDDYADPSMVPLLQRALPYIHVMKKSALFNAYGQYTGPQGRALVIHNNGDAFGQNIETEGPTSLDGVIGTFSDAALHLDRKRADLIHFVY